MERDLERLRVEQQAHLLKPSVGASQIFSPSSGAPAPPVVIPPNTPGGYMTASGNADDPEARTPIPEGNQSWFNFENR